jgi:hypothetical protein
VKARRVKAAARAPIVTYTWPCVVLAVDTATRSGWAIRVAGKLRYSGELDTLDEHELDAVITDALKLTHGGAHLVLVLERAWGQRTATLLALGAARERWLAAWRRRGLTGKYVQVYPSQWRARVLPGHAHAKREIIRPIELAAAQLEVGSTCNVGPDEAAAILISRWAAHAPQVGAVLPKRVRTVVAKGELL